MGACDYVSERRARGCEDAARALRLRRAREGRTRHGRPCGGGDGEQFFTYTLPHIENPVSTHGTGCSLAAALAAELALGHALPDAVAGAKAFVHRAIATSYWVGPDCGVLGWGADAPKPRITSQTAGE